MEGGRKGWKAGQGSRGRVGRTDGVRAGWKDGWTEDKDGRRNGRRVGRTDGGANRVKDA